MSVRWSSCKGPIILVRFQRNLAFLNRFSKSTEISNFMKIHPVGDVTDRYCEASSRFSHFYVGAYKRILVSAVNSELLQTRRCNPWKCELQIIKNYLHKELSSGFNSNNGSWLTVHRLFLTLHVSDSSYISSVSKASVSM